MQESDTNVHTEEMQQWQTFIYQLQDSICAILEKIDGTGVFTEEHWQRTGGGGGRTRILSLGQAIEKGGVNVSYVHGKVTDIMRQQLDMQGDNWAACGLSMVIHPINPWAPTFHANWRYFELYNELGTTIDKWYGGGMDLTPYYLIESDAKLFHNNIKKAMDPFGKDLYPKYKKVCDEYFNNHHRGTETRGIGGVFYDNLRPDGDHGMDQNRLFLFQKANAASFFTTYPNILKLRKDMPYNAKQKYWQEIRRGRYVEFNLLHDRGTLFGLKTNGRVESIMMSLPPTVRFDYNFIPEAGSKEEELLHVLQHPKDWADD